MEKSDSDIEIFSMVLLEELSRNRAELTRKLDDTTLLKEEAARIDAAIDTLLVVQTVVETAIEEVTKKWKLRD